MKRTVSLVTALIMVLTLAACSSTAPAGTSAPAATTAPAVTTAPAATTASAGAKPGNKYTVDPQNFYYGKTVTWVVPWAAGGSTDITSRALANELQDYLGCTIVVLNVNGGGGLVGFNTIIGANPDGFTIGSATSSMLLFVASGKSQVTYDQAEWISMFQYVPAAIMVPSDSSFNTLEDLISYGKANQGKLNYSTSGFGNYTHAAVSGLGKLTGASFTLVPYDSGTAAATAAAGGHVDFTACAVSEGAAMVDSNKLKILAIIGDDRSAKYPDVKSTTELGHPGIQSTFTSVVMPPKSPDAAKTTLADALKNIITSQYWIDFIEKQGAIGKYMGGPDFTKYLSDLNAQFASIKL